MIPLVALLLVAHTWPPSGLEADVSCLGERIEAARTATTPPSSLRVPPCTALERRLQPIAREQYRAIGVLEAERDAAIAERDLARIERDRQAAKLQLRTGTTAAAMVVPDPSPAPSSGGPSALLLGGVGLLGAGAGSALVAGAADLETAAIAGAGVVALGLLLLAYEAVDWW